MLELEKKNNCWGCGREAGGCICENGFIPLEIRPPNEILPFCKSSNEDAPWEDPTRFDEVMARECCGCGKFWMCDYKEFTTQNCPNCKAHTSFGAGKNKTH